MTAELCLGLLQVIGGTVRGLFADGLEARDTAGARLWAAVGRKLTEAEELLIEHLEGRCHRCGKLTAPYECRHGQVVCSPTCRVRCAEEHIDPIREREARRGRRDAGIISGGEFAQAEIADAAAGRFTPGLRLVGDRVDVRA